MIALFIQDRILNCPTLSQFPGASLCEECCITSTVIIWELAHCTTIERLFIVSFSVCYSQPGETTAEFSLNQHTRMWHMTHTHALLGCPAIWTRCIFIMCSLWQTLLNQGSSEIHYTERFLLCKDTCGHSEWKRFCARKSPISVYLCLNGIISHSPDSPPPLHGIIMRWKPCVCGGKGLKASYWGWAFCQGEGTKVKCAWRFSFFRQWLLKGKEGQSS